MINMNSLDLADLAKIVQPLVDEIPGPVWSVDLSASGHVTVHTRASVSDFPAEQVWNTNISPTYVTSLNIAGIDVAVFAKGEPYTKDGEVAA